MNWAQSIEQAFDSVIQAFNELAAISDYSKRFKGQAGYGDLEKKQADALQNVKSRGLPALMAAWEYRDLDEAEKKELDGHYQKALKHFKGDKLKAIGAAAVKLQLYKIGELFSAKETRQFLGKGEPVAIRRTARAPTFRPVWVPLAKCAKIVGISRNTVAAWHKQGWQMVEAPSGRMQKVILKRHPGNGMVNLPLVQNIAQAKRAAAAPGKPLNKAQGQLAGLIMAAQPGSPQKIEASHTVRALAAIEKIQSPGLLLQIRATIKKRLQLRKKQSAKRQRGRSVPFNDALDYQGASR